MSKLLGYIIAMLGWGLTASPTLGIGIPFWGLDGSFGAYIGLILVVLGCMIIAYGLISRYDPGRR